MVIINFCPVSTTVAKPVTANHLAGSIELSLKSSVSVLMAGLATDGETEGETDGEGETEGLRLGDTEGE